jgi:hypothetical protein
MNSATKGMNGMQKRQASRNRLVVLILGLVALAFYVGFIVEHL